MRFLCAFIVVLAGLQAAQAAGSVLMAGVAAVDATLPVGVPLGMLEIILNLVFNIASYRICDRLRNATCKTLIL
jgi:hypothetical protein